MVGKSDEAWIVADEWCAKGLELLHGPRTANLSLWGYRPELCRSPGRNAGASSTTPDAGGGTEVKQDPCCRVLDGQARIPVGVVFASLFRSIIGNAHRRSRTIHGAKSPGSGERRSDAAGGTARSALSVSREH